MALQIVLSDLFGPAIVPVPGALHVVIFPKPEAAVTHTYTVTVTDTVTGMPVPMAAITLQNYDDIGVSNIITATTDQAGRARISVNLNARTVIRQPSADRERDTITIKPLLTVQHQGYTSVNIALL
jgi:hypothetical protein